MPRRSVWLAQLSTVEVAALAAARTVLAVPLGSTEQHGAHLPLSVDTDIAVELCHRLAQRRDDVLIAPPVPYGSSGEHAGFAGTLSIGQAAVEMLALELGRSACDTFDRLLFVSAHGGNTEAVCRAVTRLRAESRDVRVFVPRWSGDAHAGRPETSMLLALTPGRVQMQHAVAGDSRPLEQLLPQLRAGGVLSITDTGVLGDPRGADQNEGARLLDMLANDLNTAAAHWFPAAAGTSR